MEPLMNELHEQLKNIPIGKVNEADEKPGEKKEESEEKKEEEPSKPAPKEDDQPAKYYFVVSDESTVLAGGGAASRGGNPQWDFYETAAEATEKGFEEFKRWIGREGQAHLELTVMKGTGDFDNDDMVYRVLAKDLTKGKWADEGAPGHKDINR